MQTLVRSVVAVSMLALAGCGTTTDPNAYDLEPLRLARLKTPQRVAVKNFYPPETLQRTSFGTNVDVHQFSETAIAILSRALERQGITVAPEAEKTLVVRVSGVTFGQQNMMSPMTRAGLFLDVSYADGTRSSILGKNVGFGDKAIDGAVLHALNELSGEGAFVAYMNK